MQYFTELPPTPSSSTLSFRLNEKEDILGNDHSYKICQQQLIVLDREENSISSFRSYYSYGSIETSSSSKSTTISSHDNDDEGLYLYWTNQLLKERGYEPSPLKRYMNDNDDDNDSIASSISDISSATVYQKRKSWLSSWLPFCL